MKRSLCFAVTALLLAAGSQVFGEELDLQKLKELATTYDKYAHTDAEGTWEKGEMLPTAKAGDEKAWTAEGATVTIEKEGMKVVAPQNTGGYVTLAKRTFQGPIGIRYEAMTPADAVPCDLSVRFGTAGKAGGVGGTGMVAFAFGGYANNQNFFYIGKQRKVLADTPLITAGQWYAVEFMLYPASVAGKVDNKAYGKEKLPAPVREDAEHDVTLYVWGTTGVFRNVQMLKYVPPKTDARTWQEAMGKVTKEELKAMADKAGTMLGDDAFAKRQLAEEILFLLRPLSDDAVRAQLKSGDPEVQVRARKLAQRTGLAEASTQPKQPVIMREGVDSILPDR